MKYNIKRYLWSYYWGHTISWEFRKILYLCIRWPLVIQYSMKHKNISIFPFSTIYNGTVLPKKNSEKLFRAYCKRRSEDCRGREDQLLPYSHRGRGSTCEQLSPGSLLSALTSLVSMSVRGLVSTPPRPLTKRTSILLSPGLYSSLTQGHCVDR